MSAGTRKSIKDRMAEGLNQLSLKDFFTHVVSGICIGLLMLYFNDVISYTINMTIGVTTVVVSFLMFAIPKIIASLHPSYPRPLDGSTLAIGMDGDLPRVNDKNRVKLIQPEF